MQKKTKKGLFWLALLLFGFTFSGIFAAWHDNIPNQLTQPDGTIIDVLYSGDEFHNWSHNESMFTIIQDDLTGFWCWAKAVNGNLVSTGYPVHLHDPKILGLVPGENVSNEIYLQKRAFMDADNNSRSDIRSPSVGVVQNVVVYIRFADDEEFTKIVAFYDSMFNDAGENVNSLYQYFWDASYNQLEVYSPFFPTNNGSTIVSYQSPHPRSYFQPYNAVTNPNGYPGGSNGIERRTREHALLRDAIAYIHDQVPANMIIDSDNDGNVDNVCFVIRGGTGAWAELLWPHRWTLSTFNVSLRGKRVWDYNFNIESSMDSSGVSVLAHEFGHSLGLPDFYRYDDNTITPIGRWDLMASNTSPPQSISAHAKQKYTQWVPSLPIITTSGQITLYPNSISPENHAVRINSPNSTSEYFVVEYRSRNTGLIDSAIPGSGLLIYRVNPVLNGNAQGPPDELYVYRPGGTVAINGSINNAHFSADTGRTIIHDYSDPSSFLSNGLPGGLFIHNIGFADETISFNVIIGNPNPIDFIESFENQHFTDLDWIMDSVAPWTISNEFASHGNYSAVSGNVDHNQSSSLELNIICETGFVQFYFKTSTQLDGDFLRFYINSQEVSSWSGENDATHFFMPVGEGLNSFKWVYQKNNSAVSGSDKVWIDQIGFPNIKGHILYPVKNLDHTLDDRLISLNWDTPFVSNMPDPPLLLGYDVFQNSVKLNDTPLLEKQFEISNATGGSMQFWVVAVYDIGESERSNVVLVSLPLLAPVNLQANNEGAGVRLNWEFPVESHTLSGFRISRNEQVITSTVLPSNIFTYHDTNVVAGETYVYFVRAMFINPAGMSPPSNEVSIVSVSESEIDPVYLNYLGINYPNPFNPETTIGFSIQNDSDVKLEIFNVRGALVRTLINSKLSRGDHTVIWDGKNNQEKQMASGVYFYRIEADDFLAVRRMVLLK